MGKMRVTPYQNKNDKMVKAYGKWFMRAKPYGALSVEDLSNHIAMDSKVERTLVGEITKAVVKQMKELLMNGHPIRVPHLGLLKVQVSTEGAETKEEFNAGKHVKNAHLILVPTVEIKEEMRKMKFEKDYEPEKTAGSGGNSGAGSDSGSGSGEGGDNNGGGAPPAGDDDNEVPGEG